MLKTMKLQNEKMWVALPGSNPGQHSGSVLHSMRAKPSEAIHTSEMQLIKNIEKIN